MIRYINARTYEGIETIDEVDSADFKTVKEFRVEVKRLVNEYASAFNGALVWASQKSTKAWKER